MEKKIIRQSGDVRRSQIKSAVKEIIFYDGLQNLTTKNIAKKVGISEGTVFKHFTSKKAIIDGILDDVLEELVKPLGEIAAGHADTALRLEQYICFHLNYLTRNKGITILLFTEASYQNDLALKQRLNKTYQSLAQSFASIVKQGMEEGIWDSKVPVNDLASLYMGIPLSMNIELLLHEGNMKERHYCNNMLELIKRILKK